jgi:hypothetical protein
MSLILHRHAVRGGIVAVTAIVMLMAGGSARAEQSLTRAQLAALAEGAALAGAAGFADAATDEDALAHAIHAAQAVIGDHAGVQAEIIPSFDQRSVTVNLSGRGPERRSIGPGVKIADVTATARFVPPDRPAKWAWASRNYFVAAAPEGWRQAQSPPPASAATSSR